MKTVVVGSGCVQGHGITAERKSTQCPLSYDYLVEVTTQAYMVRTSMRDCGKNTTILEKTEAGKGGAVKEANTAFRQEA